MSTWIQFLFIIKGYLSRTRCQFSGDDRKINHTCLVEQLPLQWQNVPHYDDWNYSEQFNVMDLFYTLECFIPLKQHWLVVHFLFLLFLYSINAPELKTMFLNRLLCLTPDNLWFNLQAANPHIGEDIVINFCIFAWQTT